MATVLVADDDQELLDGCRCWLDRHGDWSIRMAANGDEAIALAADGVDAAYDRYITKPVRRDDLIGAIEAAASLPVRGDKIY